MLSAPAAHACSCAALGSLVQVAKRSDSVIRGKVLEYRWDQSDVAQKGIPIAMIVEIKEVYKGTPKLSQVKVLAGNGLSCRPYATQFPIGSEWIFAVSKISDGASKKEFALSECAESLVVKDDRAIGNVSGSGSNPKPQVVRLSNLRNLLKAGF